jgi:prepilin-type N-terminal cleavage/methylation domain-containing protein
MEMMCGISSCAVRRKLRGFTLVEIAIVLLITGLLVASVIQGQQLIQGARVRSVIATQDAIATAVLAFQDRFQALPGDYVQAGIFIACTPACPAGNGNGRIEDTGTPRESILVWTHLANAGFLNGSFSATSATSSVDAGNTPQNMVGGYLQVAFDNSWGYSANPVRRHNIKTGNNLPVEVMAEADRKADDGLPGSGRIQFSPYAASGDAPAWGGSATSCVTMDTTAAAWNIAGDQSNCGGATLL